MGGYQGMVTTEQETPGRATVAQRWLARLALVAAAAAVLVPLAAIGFGQSVALVLVGLVGMGLAAAGVWWALTHKGPAHAERPQTMADPAPVAPVAPASIHSGALGELDGIDRAIYRAIAPGPDRAVAVLCDRVTWRSLGGCWLDEAEGSAGHG